MSPSLRFDIARLVASESLFSIPLITVMEDSFKGFASYALFLMKPLCFLKSETVLKSGGPGREMFFLIEGQCELINSDTGAASIICENAIVEQYALIAPSNEMYRSLSNITALSTRCVLYSLSKDDFK
jgi:CRP-like cAMP-binding protein